MSTVAFVIGSVLWILVLSSLWYLVVQKSPDESTGGDESPAIDETESRDDDGTPKSLTIRFPSRELPDFEFPECMGGTVSRESMRGKRWLASFVFTRCVETCPMITRNVSELHRRVAESNPDFQFVTFSVDSSFDSAEVLKKYAETFQADNARWKFLTGDENRIHELIRGGFAQFVQANLGEMRKPGFEVAHSNRAVLVNEDCIPVATFLMTNPEDVVRLRRVIEGKTEFPEPEPALSIGPTIGENPAVAVTAVPVQEASAESQNSRIKKKLPAWLASLPRINATLNSVCTFLLIAGFVAIRCGRRVIHRNLMITAFVVSIAFLSCYLTYHQGLYHYTGERGRAFVGSDTAKTAYFCILIPHVILAVFVPILAIRVFVHAYRERWAEHRRLAKITLPIWLFVSITGVVIYWMLYHWPWRDAVASL